MCAPIKSTRYGLTPIIDKTQPARGQKRSIDEVDSPESNPSNKRIRYENADQAMQPEISPFEEHYRMEQVWHRFLKKHRAGKSEDQLNCIHDEATAMAMYACRNEAYQPNIVALKKDLVAKNADEPVTDTALTGKVFALCLKIVVLASENRWPLGTIYMPVNVNKTKKTVKPSPSMKLFHANPIVHKLAGPTDRSCCKGMLLLKFLGKGTFNNATLVYHQSLKKELVLRQLDLGRISNKDQAESDWKNETNIHRKLLFKGVSGLVNLHEVYVLDHPNNKIRALMLEKCEGSCKDFVKNPSLLEDRQRVSMFKQRISTLIQMHTLNCIHSDHKPANVFYIHDDNGNLITKIGDLGLAEEALKFKGGKIGTPLYKPLEAFCYRNSNEKCAGYGILKDSWAEGLVAYEIKYGSFDKHTKLVKEIVQFQKTFFKIDKIQEFKNLDAIMSISQNEDLPTSDKNNRMQLFDQLKNLYPEEIAGLPEINLDSLNHYSRNEFIKHLHNLFLIAKFQNRFEVIFNKLCHKLNSGLKPYEGDREDQAIAGLLNPDPNFRLTVEMLNNLDI